jgi:hypothetical protein
LSSNKALHWRKCLPPKMKTLECGLLFKTAQAALHLSRVYGVYGSGVCRLSNRVHRVWSVLEQSLLFQPDNLLLRSRTRMLCSPKDRALCIRISQSATARPSGLPAGSPRDRVPGASRPCERVRVFSPGTSLYLLWRAEPPRRFLATATSGQPTHRAAG